jgi:hypothetical protein
VLVDGPADLNAARAIQDGLKITPTQGGSGAEGFAQAPTVELDPELFVSTVNEALGRSTVPPKHAARIRRLAPAGIRPGDRMAWSRLDAATKAAWRDNIDALYSGLRDGLAANSVQRNGWSYPKPGIGNFGDNDVYRSAVAMEGLAALEPVEALYMFARTAGDGQRLTGERSYRLRVPANVPVDGFWSLSMYEESPEGRLYFIENPIRRYSIGNRTPGLKRNADGSIDILVQNAQPPAAESANWLPAPVGPFRISFRAYLPRPQFREGSFLLPGVEVLSRANPSN